jgi:outer membrane protein assembly factor BamB
VGEKPTRPPAAGGTRSAQQRADAAAARRRAGRPGQSGTPHRPSAQHRSRRRRQQIARRRAAALATLVAIVIILVVALAAGRSSPRTPGAAVGVGSVYSPAVHVSKDGDGIKLATFLGTASRRFYGLGPAPRRLQVIWKTRIGGGWTSGKFAGDPNMYWSGTGWTGMPALVQDGGKLSVLIGGYDHKLHRIDAATGKILWAYDFGDVIKSSPSVIANPHPTSADDKYLVLAGSRRGFGLKMGDPSIASYRAVSFGSGKEVWRLPVPRTLNYTQDTDGSGFFMDGLDYIGVEPGWFYGLDPFRTQPWQVGGKTYRRPVAVRSRLLLGTAADAARDPVKHKEGVNLAIEASPALLGDTIYIDSGDGHVYGLRRSDLAVVFDYRVGSDMDGTTVPTRSGKLLVPIEKQYIKGHGGIMMLDPSKPAAHSPVWFFPTADRPVAEWRGGVIGSVAVNDEYGGATKYPPLAAFNAIDGNLYIVSQDTLAPGTVRGPNRERGLRTPVMVAKTWVNSAISTPIIVDDTVVDAAYDNVVHLYHLAYKPSSQGAAGALRSRDGHWWTVSLHQTASFTAGSAFESTPVLWNGRVYIGSRDGWFYCLGDK